MLRLEMFRSSDDRRGGFRGRMFVDQEAQVKS
jgi:hypothetical protein